jgi:hypothetical protein
MAGKTGTYVFIASLVMCLLSIAISFALAVSGNSFAKTTMARIIATFGGASLKRQAMLACPSLESYPKDDSEALDYISGSKTCPEVVIRDTPAKSGIPPNIGSVTRTITGTGTPGSRSGL